MATPTNKDNRIQVSLSMCFQPDCRTFRSLLLVLLLFAFRDNVACLGVCPNVVGVTAALEVANFKQQQQQQQLLLARRRRRRRRRRLASDENNNAKRK